MQQILSQLRARGFRTVRVPVIVPGGREFFTHPSLGFVEDGSQLVKRLAAEEGMTREPLTPILPVGLSISKLREALVARRG
jgi:hypothetical protein